MQSQVKSRKTPGCGWLRRNHMGVLFLFALELKKKDRDTTRDSCLGQGSLPASRSLPRRLDLCAAYGPQVPWDDTILSEAVHDFDLFKVGSVQT